MRRRLSFLSRKFLPRKLKENHRMEASVDSAKHALQDTIDPDGPPVAYHNNNLPSILRTTDFSLEKHVLFRHRDPCFDINLRKPKTDFWYVVEREKTHLPMCSWSLQRTRKVPKSSWQAWYLYGFSRHFHRTWYTYSPWKTDEPWRSYDHLVVVFKCLRGHSVHVLFLLLSGQTGPKNRSTFKMPSLPPCLFRRKLHRKEDANRSKDRDNDFALMNHASQYFRVNVFDEYLRKRVMRIVMGYRVNVFQSHCNMVDRCHSYFCCC